MENSINEKQSYPFWNEEDMIVNLEQIKELKEVNFKEIDKINNLIKNNWIYITCHPNNTILLGRI